MNLFFLDRCQTQHAWNLFAQPFMGIGHFKIVGIEGFEIQCFFHIKDIPVAHCDQMGLF